MKPIDLWLAYHALGAEFDATHAMKSDRVLYRAAARRAVTLLGCDMTLPHFKVAPTKRGVAPPEVIARVRELTERLRVELTR